jgi:hypothetical protein
MVQGKNKIRKPDEQALNKTTASDLLKMCMILHGPKLVTVPIES